jgi:hypothetical protein
VISFDELKRWLAEEDVRIDGCEDEPFPFNPAVNRLYPVTGGVLASVRAGLSEEASRHYRQFAVHGLSNCIELCRDIEAGSVHRCVIEMNSCENGCIKGPAVSGNGVYPYKIKLDMQDAIRLDPAPQEELRRRMEGVCLDKKFEDRSLDEPMPTEEEIRQILAKIFSAVGKFPIRHSRSVDGAHPTSSAILFVLTLSHPLPNRASVGALM